MLLDTGSLEHPRRRRRGTHRFDDGAVGTLVGGDSVCGDESGYASSDRVGGHGAHHPMKAVVGLDEEMLCID